jgi:hypothetical protein
LAAISLPYDGIHLSKEETIDKQDRFSYIHTKKKGILIKIKSNVVVIKIQKKVMEST